MAARSLAFAVLALTACGGAAAPAPEAKDPAPAAESPAAACLRAAGAPRQRAAKEPDRVGLKHVLVKYAGAKNAPASVTRSREEACLRAMEARDKLRGGAEIDAVVGEYSEEAGAATRGGSLGRVERKDLVPPVADAAFELERNQLSDVVESPFGFHLVLRTE
jgi:peptidyl-prolyl cis-trans isomerase NIMA-interacting 1